VSFEGQFLEVRMKKVVTALVSVALGVSVFACQSVSSSTPSSLKSVQTEGADETSPYIGTLKYVPVGAFQRDENPADVSVITKPFHLSQYDITRAQFLSVMGTDPSLLINSTGTSDPAQQVNWYQAIAFCNKLSLKEGLSPVYTVPGVDFSKLSFTSIPVSNDSTWDSVSFDANANGYRLPTETEWMWAALGASKDALPGDVVQGVNRGGYLKGYSGSTEPHGAQSNVNNYAWTASVEPAPTRTNPVGKLLPNELGLYDQSGNVFQWCWDWYAAYPSGTLVDYTGPASGSFRIDRGGGWANDATGCTVAIRYYGNPPLQGNNFGFRVARN
jgi:formylglycine-generating enzyme required for sulfatase activity